MYTITCNITLNDGSVVTAKAATTSPFTRVPVDWSGRVERVTIDDYYRVCEVSSLRLYCKVMAKKLGARYEENSEGKFDRGER